jgi:hypothetical protein
MEIIRLLWVLVLLQKIMIVLHPHQLLVEYLLPLVVVLMVVVMLVLMLHILPENLVDPAVAVDHMEDQFLVVLQQVMELVTVVELVTLLVILDMLVVEVVVPVLLAYQEQVLAQQIGLMVVMDYNILNLKVV